LPIKGPIYEFGAFQVKGQEHIANLRPFFKGMEYVGTDMRKGNGVDVVMNYQKLPLKDKSINTAISCETLEHTEYPREAMSEIYRVLKDGGICVITSVFSYHIHDHPYDYFRFTPESFKSLLKDFDSVYVGWTGPSSIMPVTIVGIGVKGKKGFFNDKMAFRNKVRSWKMHYDSIAKRQEMYNTNVPAFVRWPFRQAKLLVRKSIISMSPKLREAVVNRNVYKGS
jgi:SAM-dependent methyltransferase